MASSSVLVGVKSIGALVGMSSAGWLIDRFGAGKVLTPALLLGALSTGVLGFAAVWLAAISACLICVGLAVGIGASGSIALATLTYPTPIRSSGVGWAMGMGRFGQVLAPLFASGLTAAGWSDVDLFLLAGLAPLAGALAILALHLRGETSGAAVAAELRLVD